MKINKLKDMYKVLELYLVLNIIIKHCSSLTMAPELDTYFLCFVFKLREQMCNQCLFVQLYSCQLIQCTKRTKIDP